jgi:hypothetical protein
MPAFASRGDDMAEMGADKIDFGCAGALPVVQFLIVMGF